LWAIVCFFFHQTRWTADEKDGLFWQLQALFRSNPGDLGMSWRLYELWKNWRNRTNNVTRRISPFLILCFIHFLAFTAAGLFSSRVANANNEVLIKPSVNCGEPDISLALPPARAHTLTAMEETNVDALIVFARDFLLLSKIAARTCYPRLDGTPPDLGSSQCQIAVKPWLESKVNTSAECPFVAEACLTQAISLDTGLLDSHTHFGINSPLQDRIQFRRKTVCSVLPMEERYKLSDPSFGNNDTEYYFLGNITDNSYGYLANYTFSVSQAAKYRMGPYSPMYVLLGFDDM
jgi:hypothetical protein